MGHTIAAITWTFSSIAILATICRSIVRLPRFGGKFSWDDYGVILCVVVLVPFLVIAQLLLDNGLGQDIWMLDPARITDTLFVCQPLASS
jgi:hypothetical protein